MQGATTPPLILRLFGPFEALLDGVPLPGLRRRQARWLLALLALRAGRPVERTWLAGVLWPEAPEATGLKNLRSSLADLRRVLGPAATRLCSPSSRTLCLELTHADADVLTFDAAIGAGDGGSLEQAVTLYRGPLLEGCGEEWAFQERQPREQAYLAALETLAAQAIARGEIKAAERHLWRAVTTDPFLESTQRALMRTLVDDGNYAAAILTYRELRLRLHREINAAPDAETTALFQQLRAEARQRAQSPVEPPEPIRHNLPLQLTSFIGREGEIAEVKRHLQGTRLLTLTGAGGCGKTRLALQVAADRVDEFTDGAWLVELAALSYPGLVVPTAAAALGVREEPGRPLTHTLMEYLRERSLLLVLDNCEHLLGGCAELAERLLQSCPHLRVLATSREGLRLGGEQTYRVPSLSVPDPTQLPPLEGLRKFEAVRLFADRAALSQPRFTVTPRNAAAVAQVCHQLEGIPLAIELAAARVRALPVEKIAERLNDIFRLLTGGVRTALPRHQTLRALIDWSYDLLGEPERVLLRRLSVFAGGWTLEAAEAVGGGEGIEAGEVLDLLTSLVDKSLVLYEERMGEARYRLLETVRQYGRDRLLEAGEGEAVRERHGEFFLQLAEAARAAAGQGQGAEAFERLEPDHDNLRAALAGSDERDAERALRLAGAMGMFWFERGYWNEGHQWLESSLAVEPGAEPTAERARALALAGRFAANRHDFLDARNRLEESISQYRRLGDTRGLVEALVYLSEVNQWWGANPATTPMLEEAVALARTVGDPRLLSMALRELGLATGEFGTARTLLEKSLALARQLGDGGLLGQSLWILGRRTMKQGDWARARELLEECVCQARAAKNNVLGCRARYDLATVVSQQGDPERAKSLGEESLRMARERHTPLLVAEAFAELARHAPSAEEALQWLAQSVRERGRGPIVGTLNEVAMHAPSYEEALRTVDQAAREYGPEVTFNPLVVLGNRARWEGNYDGAATCYRRMLVLSQKVGGPFGFLGHEVGGSLGIAQSLEALAGLAGRQQQWERAATLLGAAEGVCAAIGATPSAWIDRDRVNAEEYERAVRDARAALSEEAFAAAWAEGQAMSVDQAITAALEGETLPSVYDRATGPPNLDLRPGGRA